MIKETVYIEKPLEEVWDYVHMEFAKSFKCSPSQLEGKEIKSKARTMNGEIEIIQTATKVIPNELIEVVSIGGNTISTKIYEFVGDDEGTYLTTGEKGEGKDSFIKTMNYKILSLPILRNSTKKKMRQGLAYIKADLEGTLEEILEGEED